MYRFICFNTGCRKYFESETYNQRSYCSLECERSFELEYIMQEKYEVLKPEGAVLMLRAKGYGIAEISKLLDLGLCAVCDIIRAQNDKDKANDK